MPMWFAEEISSGAACAPVSMMAQSATTISAIEGLEGEGAMSQVESQMSDYPMNDIAVTLSSGTIVRIRNIVVFRSQSRVGLTVYIETPTPSTEPERLALEAKEVAELQKSPTTDSATSVSVGVCRTQGCLEMRERPQEMFVFARKPDGSLQAQRPPDSI